MINGLNALKIRFNNYLKDESKKVIENEITNVGIKRKTGDLLNSINFLGETKPWYWEIAIESDYASYLNDGYDSFDMKKGLIGKTIPLQTPEGLIFRKVSPNSTGWIHPGWEATHFVQNAEKKLYEGILKIVDESFSELS